MTTTNGKTMMTIAIGCMAWAIAGCPNVTSGVRLDAYPEVYAEVVCERLFACCDTGEIDAMFDGITDLASCEASLAAVARRSIAAADGAGQRYDTAAAGQCVDGIEALACPDFATWRTTSNETRTACDAVFVGTRGLGATCESSGECEGTRVCADGLCADALSIGGDCTDAAERCPRGAHCYEGACRTPQPAGAPCSFPSHCTSNACESGACGSVVSCNGR